MHLDLSFVILSLDKNPIAVRNTLNSISWSNKNSQTLCIVAQGCTEAELQSLNQVCETYIGEDTITSLINEGVKAAKNPWVFIVYSGSRLKTNIQNKLGIFVNSDKDICFPIVDGKTNFVDGSSNGILVNKKTFTKIGEFPKMKSSEIGNDFEIAKLLWANEAIQQGCKFKAIAGIRMT